MKWSFPNHILSYLSKLVLNCLPLRIQALLQWVHDSSRVAAHKMSGPMGYACAGSSSTSPREYGLLMPSPSHLHCVAAILWHSYELPVDYDLPALLDRELFESVIVFSLIIKNIHARNSLPRNGNLVNKCSPSP